MGCGLSRAMRLQHQVTCCPSQDQKWGRCVVDRRLSFAGTFWHLPVQHRRGMTSHPALLSFLFPRLLRTKSAQPIPAGQFPQLTPTQPAKLLRQGNLTQRANAVVASVYCG